jgi:hypothetical protein
MPQKIESPERIFKICTSINNPYTRCGLVHFANKYGISLVSPVSQDIDIFIGYFKPKSNIARVIIVTMPEIQERINKQYSINDLIINRVLTAQKNYNELSRLLEIEICNLFKILSNNTIGIQLDLFREIGKHIAGKYDELYTRKDDFGNFLRFNPVVDILEACLLSRINLLLPNLKSNLPGQMIKNFH